MWTLLAIAVGVAIAGYIYHRWPEWFKSKVDAGAAVVNDQIDKVKDATDGK